MENEGRGGTLIVVWRRVGFQEVGEGGWEKRKGGGEAANNV